MSSAIKEAFKKAYEAKGIELPTKKTIASPVKPSSPPLSHSPTKVQEQRPSPSRPSNSRNKTPRRTRRDLLEATLNRRHAPRTDYSVYEGKPSKPSQPTQHLPEYELNITGEATPAFQVSTAPDDYYYLPPGSTGKQTQAHNGEWRDEREIVIGLDFGTSSVKIVIGDQTEKVAFAVPFSNAEGVNRYLLPSRLYQSDSTFRLSGGMSALRDLKLSLLANPNDLDAQVKVTAFLGLLIRHARGWLLSEHEGIYKHSHILWKLVLGLPSAHHLHGENQELFERLAAAAWRISALDLNDIGFDDVLNVLTPDKGAVTVDPDFAEICVVPEIAAQIYGYVSSTSFDPHARNIFLMVDIGAGTVDSCLFKVAPGKGGKWDFTFYTTQVQPNGVMNLHRHRMDWWKKTLTTHQDKLRLKTDGFESTMLFTDRLTSIPQDFKDYFSGIEIKFRDGCDSPDRGFFMQRVVSQVRGSTLWKTWHDGHMAKEDLEGIPMYLCGGGSRMEYYKNLEPEMSKFPGCSWLSAISRSLQVPSNLRAPGLPSRDYDRLSVAFGLSFLEIRKVLQAIPVALLPAELSQHWHDFYVSKDQC